MALARATLMRITAAAARSARVCTHTHTPALALPAMTASRAFGALSKSGNAEENQSLETVLSRELQYEREDGTSPSTLSEIASTLTGWKVADVAGNARFSLTRKAGAQTVRVDLDCSPMPSEEDEAFDEENQQNEEEEGPAEGYRMLVTVKDDAKGKVMHVGAFITDHLRIHRVTLYEAGKEPTADQVFGGFDENPVYGGPAFDELDTALQNAFYEYLAERGVDDSFADKLADYCSAKEQTEYVRWLEEMKKFTA